ncbi:MAG: hypothetical protein OXC14_12820 [Rhodospirillaceae bacterium]|nr:hypothetical protein [Rhodospirillaceae bacterium]
MAATFQYCLDNGFLGVGWRVDNLTNTRDWKEYERAGVPLHQSIQKPRYIYENVTVGDLVWTRDPAGQYYLARVTGGWQYLTNPKEQELNIDIENVFHCEFYRVPLDAVPGTVVSGFGARGRTIQQIHNLSARVYSQHLWNGWVEQRIYEIDVADFPDIFAMLDPEETEDLVFLYLQNQGWYVVPNSRKSNTLRFEFMLAHSETGEKALTQVKTGNVSLNIDDYANDAQRIFLFQSKEYYDGRCTDNVSCIRRDDLTTFFLNNIG